MDLQCQQFKDNHQSHFNVNTNSSSPGWRGSRRRPAAQVREALPYQACSSGAPGRPESPKFLKGDVDIHA